VYGGGRDAAGRHRDKGALQARRRCWQQLMVTDWLRPIGAPHSASRCMHCWHTHSLARTRTHSHSHHA
jgi:hypothetical protein